MFWRVIGSIGAITFIGGGMDIASTGGCAAVDFGGHYRRASYTCTFGQYPGDLSAGAASFLMIGGGIAFIALLWIPLIIRNRRGY